MIDKNTNGNGDATATLQVPGDSTYDNQGGHIRVKRDGEEAVYEDLHFGGGSALKANSTLWDVLRSVKIHPDYDRDIEE